IQRFAKVATSRALAGIKEGWQQRVTVVGGELSQPACGIKAADRAEMQPKLTHIIHCAASVEFTLPIADAAAANITSALNVLELARGSANLKHMVAVSTAYVNPASRRPMPEALVPMPFEPEEVYADILSGRADEKALMAVTGHANTYTLTKCINEHLLNQRRGDVPLSIVRPSIVSATLQHPFPGWIDSHAAFAGFVALIGAGHLNALRADTSVRLDIVPCDVVADRAIDTCVFETPAKPEEAPVVRYAVAGLKDSPLIGECVEEIVKFFKNHPIDREPSVKWVGTQRSKFKLKAAQHHGTRRALANSVLTMTGKTRLRRQYNKVMDRVEFLNEAFPYFTHNQFDFRPTVGIPGPDYDPAKYVAIACEGVYTHLTRKDSSQMSLAGRKHRDGSPDLRWIMKQPAGNWAVRGASYALRKALRRCTESVTFDRPAFEAARQGIPDDALVVIIPTHRSYMDFLVCSYLFFARSDLGIRIPHIAAAEEFSRIPVLGWLFQQTHAFYIRRGMGGEDKELTAKVQDLVKRRETLEFFIEGARSRSRQFLQPRRGLLRALQNTGETCMILPVAITYDRVPEERTFLRELQGEGKPKMQLRKLLMWTTKMASGRVDLGRVHVTCGEPLLLDKSVDVHGLSYEVMAQLQQHTHSTTHHMRCFLARNPIGGVDEHTLRSAIERRGGKVFDSGLDGHEEVDAEIERTMRYNWQHLFFPEARALFPEHPAISHHINNNAYTPASNIALAEVPTSPALHRMIEILLRPVCAEYVATARWLATTTVGIDQINAATVVRNLPQCHLPTVQGVLNDLVDRGLLLKTDKKTLAWGVPTASRREALLAYADACAWPERRTTIAVENNDDAADHRVDWIPRAPLARGAGI
ncbi:MAG: SDR family oxidoreductase, partial [Myxococcales bacterium]|nr:SDR family oxidoreductase [Myxococcales bacterium]